MTLENPSFAQCRNSEASAQPLTADNHDGGTDRNPLRKKKSINIGFRDANV